MRRGLLIAVAVAGIGFQVAHLAEHGLQVLYWMVHPTVSPWLTPWAATGASVLAEVADSHPAGGAELLHLVGNLIFLAGVVAAKALARGQQRSKVRWLRLALWIQSVHVAEHVALTATWFATGSALGISTAFGSLAASPVLASTVRVWFHFAINLVATSLALHGVGAVQLIRRGGERRSPVWFDPVGAG